MIQKFERPHSVYQSSTIGAGSLSSGMGQFPVSGVVVARRSDLGAVDVKCPDGRIFMTVPVAPPYWTGYQGQSNPAAPTGGRSLPPLNSQVVIMFLDGSIERPIVLCSYPNYNETWQQSTLGEKGKENLHIEYLEKNWTLTRDDQSGDITLKSDPADSKPIAVKFSKTNSQVSVTYGNQSIMMDQAAGKMSLTVNQQSIVMDGSRYEIKNATTSLKTLLDSLISKINGATTIPATPGSPLTFNPITLQGFTQLQTEIDAFLA